MLSIVIEFDTKHVLDLMKVRSSDENAGAARYPQPRSLIGHGPPRIDWVGRPEQTNIRLNNPAMEGTDDVRDLWNRQTHLPLPEEVRPFCFPPATVGRS